MKLNLACAQYPIQMHASFQDWQQFVSDFVANAKDSQVLVFPEYGSLDLTSFLSEQERSLFSQIHALRKYYWPFIETFENLAKKHQKYILAPSFPYVEKGKAHNRAFFMGPQGVLGFQDKYKMTRFENEEWSVSSSPHSLICFETEFGQMGVNICYDVEFPQFAKTLSHQGAKLILAPSCTETLHGMNRVHVGARARALENQLIVAVAQTVGSAPWSPAVDINTGQALVCGPCDLGFPEDGILNKGKLNQPGWVQTEIDLSLVDQVREKGAVFNFKDSF
jgi:predicted amidohydrolase